MAYFTYDTSVIISRKLFDLRIRTKDLVLSSVALLEMTASATDDSQRKEWEEMFVKYWRDNALIVLYRLTHRRRRVDGGRLRQLAPGVSQRMALDALIAASARRWKAAVVTENWDHFKAIQYFCGVKLIKASEFFR
jgi:predicted nucleic acid-binding protein